MMEKSEIILYQPDTSVQLEVHVENETVWLTQAQMAQLFETTPQNVTMHIQAIYKERELDYESTCKDFLQVRIEGIRRVRRIHKYYNLDVIISVGYRVKSLRGTQFRIWANNVLRNYLLKGYAINNRVERLEEDVDYLKQKSKEFDLVVRTSLPPKEGLFFEGQVFDAFEFVQKLIKSAKKSIILIDNYIDDSVLTMFSHKQKEVALTIYTKVISPQMKLAAEKYNTQYGNLNLKSFFLCHDRLMIIDDKELYLIGASLKDLGKKWFAFCKMDESLIGEIMRRLP